MPIFNRKIVSQQFLNDFEAVAAYYNLRGTGEYETAKSVARNDLESAITTYAAISKEIA